MVGIIGILYPGFGVIMNIVFKQDIIYHVTIGDIPHCTCLDFTKCLLKHWERKEVDVLQTFSLRVISLCKVDYESDKFIHTPTYMYNEVKRLLELVGVVECE